MTDPNITERYREYINRGYQNPIDHISSKFEVPRIIVKSCISEANGWFIKSLRLYCQRMNLSVRESYRFDRSDPDDFSWSTLVATIIINDQIEFSSGRYGVTSTNLYHQPPPPYDQEKVNRALNSALDTCARDAFKMIEEDELFILSKGIQKISF